MRACVVQLLAAQNGALAHERRGVTRIYARWGQFGLRRKMAMVIERSLRETLGDTPKAAIKTAA